MNRSALWVVIVNYRTPQLVGECLASLAAQISDLPGSRVMVVDNCSGDESVDFIRRLIEERSWSSWADVVSSGRNGGFAYGNNVALRSVLSEARPPEFVLLLNPDTTVDPGALTALLEFMRSRPRVGIAGSRIVTSAGEITGSAHNFPSHLSEFEQGACLGPVTRRLRKYVVSPPVRKEAHPCDWVSGACMMIRHELLEDVGLMDEGYFLYFEEVDYCRSAKLAGWEVWYVPEASVLHIEGAATQVSDRSRRRPAYWFDSRRRFFTKHYGVGGLLLIDLLWMSARMGHSLWRLLTFYSRNHAVIPRKFAFDLLWGDLRALFLGQLGRIPKVQQTMPRGAA